MPTIWDAHISDVLTFWHTKHVDSRPKKFAAIEKLPNEAVTRKWMSSWTHVWIFGSWSPRASGDRIYGIASYHFWRFPVLTSWALKFLFSQSYSLIRIIEYNQSRSLSIACEYPRYDQYVMSCCNVKAKRNFAIDDRKSIEFSPWSEYKTIVYCANNNRCVIEISSFLSVSTRFLPPTENLVYWSNRERPDKWKC